MPGARGNWDEADKDYQVKTERLRKEQEVPDVDKDEWRIHWLYAKALPSHFQQLRRLAMLSWLTPAECAVEYPISAKKPIPVLNLRKGKQTTVDEKIICYPEIYYEDEYDRPVYNQSNIGHEGLPKECGGLQKFFNEPGDKTCLELLSLNGQSGAVLSAPNILNRELMGIRCGVCTYQSTSYSPIAIPLLLDFFGPQHISELSKLERRAFFEATLFAALRLPKAIKQLPDCAQDLQNFFVGALNYFEDLIATSQDISSSVETTAFLMMQWQRTLVYLEKGGVAKIGESSVVELLESARGKIRHMLKDPKFQGEEVAQTLHLALVDSYHGRAADPKTVVKDLASSMAAFWKSAQSTQRNQKLFPAFIESATSLPIEKQELLQKVMQAEPKAAQSILRDIAALYQIRIPEKTVWNGKLFPIFSCQITDGLIEINLLTGRFLLNKQEMAALPEEMRRKSDSWQELFGTAKLQVINYPTYCQASDAHGPIQIFIAEKEDKGRFIDKICRQIQGKWYHHIPTTDTKSHPPLPKLYSQRDLSLWCATEKPIHYMYVDTKSMKPVMRLDADGRITLLEQAPKQRWEWVEMGALDQLSDLHALDADAFILQAEGAPIKRSMQLQFPHLTDESGLLVEFERRWLDDKQEMRWVVRNRPHLFLAKEQRLPGPRRFNNFLILENAAGEKMALIPMKTKEQLKAKETVDVKCIQVNIKEEQLSSPDPHSNAYLAYLNLTHAVTPEDYQQALAFLRKARKFERYSAEELRLLGMIYKSALLGMIYKSAKVTDDYTGPADAVRLFANWLVTENLRRNPGKSLVMDWGKAVPQLVSNSPPEQWQAFWEGNFPEESPKITQNELAHYFERQADLPYGMRLQDNLSAQELVDWHLPQVAFGLDQSNVPLPSVKVRSDDIELLYNLNTTPHRPQVTIPSRPSETDLSEHFFALLKAAQSKDPERRKLAEEQFKAMRFDPERSAFTYLLAAALASQNNPAAQAVLSCAGGIINRPPAFSFSGGADLQKHADQHSLQSALEKFAPFVPSLPLQPSPLPAVTQVQVLPAFQPILLPDEPPKGQPLSYNTSHVSMDIPRFQRLFKSAFTQVPASQAAPPELFTFETKDPWLQKSIQELNADTLAGVAKNQAMPKYCLKPGLAMDKLLKVQRKAIESQKGHYTSAVLKKQEGQIVQLVNRPPANEIEALKYQAEVASGRIKALNIRDCVALFLQGDLEMYRRATHLESESEITALHNAIGDYILYHNKVTRYQEVLKAFERLDKVYHAQHTEEQLGSAVQRLAEALTIGAGSEERLQAIKGTKPSSKKEAEPNPAVLLVFEYILNLTLREDQVQGIKDMIQIENEQRSRFLSVMLQRIQGGGKSLVFGQIMALLKADGFHLSIHVPATPQYKTTLYDMRERSEKLFEQKEHTLVFDDDPAKFTPAYLTWIKQMLQECIVNRDYITMTNETLRALRCKYLKTRFEIGKASPGTNMDQLEASNQILKEILALLRSRGVFTFDEMHKAFDPLKELNMPYGQPEKPRRHESDLVGEILRTACLAKDAQQLPVLDLARSSQQTAVQRQVMKETILEQLLKKPGWNQQGIKEYLSGQKQDVPAFLETEEHKQLRQLVILARQMLTGNWLQERLETNVNENHGLPKKGFPLVSIPFVANMKPAYGSEFSDRYVMTTNTLISYLVTGLNLQQTVGLIRALPPNRRSAENKAQAENTHLFSERH